VKTIQGLLIFACATIQTGWAQTNSTILASNSVAPHYDARATLRQPAVDEFNGKIGYSGGQMDSFEGHNFDLSVAIPLTHQFGFQADGLYSLIDGEDFGGGAGHLFWRDPAFGLVGIAGGFLTQDGVDTYQVGAEAEYYYERLTIGAFAGVGHIEYDFSAPFISTDPTRFIGRVSADYYLLDDLRVGVSVATAFENNLGKVEAEYETPVRGLAITAEVAVGSNDYDHWLVGVRWYFGGGGKSLRERHRTSDPASLMPQIIHGLGLYGAEYNKKAAAYFAPIGMGYPNNYGYSSSWMAYSPEERAALIEIIRELERSRTNPGSEPRLPPLPPLPLAPQ
jgi:hypothetical protein